MQSSTLTPTYTDFNGINAMRAQARVDPEASLKQVAKQFEGIFIQMMLKSMRDASMGDDIFDSDQSKVYRDMFDKQVSLDMANSKGIGIAEALVRQLSRNTPVKGNPAEFAYDGKTRISSPASGKTLPLSVVERKQSALQQQNSDYEISAAKSEDIVFNSPEEFVEHILPYAEEAANKLGVSPLLLVSQAALETGWGKAVIRHKDGNSSFNLFNIKADKRWDGERVSKSTLEYSNGLAKYEKASFRAYDSYADSFDDYVNFLHTNTRYDNALQQQGNDRLFIKNIHEAGYATDPNYADKVIDILHRENLKEQARFGIDESKLTSSNDVDKGVLNGHV